LYIERVGEDGALATQGPALQQGVCFLGADEHDQQVIERVAPGAALLIGDRALGTLSAPV
jgi:hypothetical protein